MTGVMKRRDRGGAGIWIFALVVIVLLWAGYRVGRLYFDHSTLENEIRAVADEARTLLHQKLDLGLIQGTPEQLAALRTLKIKPRKSDIRFGVVLVDYNPNSRLLDTAALDALDFRVDVFHVGFGLWQERSTSFGQRKPGVG